MPLLLLLLLLASAAGAPVAATAAAALLVGPALCFIFYFNASAQAIWWWMLYRTLRKVTCTNMRKRSSDGFRLGVVTVVSNKSLLTADFFQLFTIKRKLKNFSCE